MTKFLPVQKLLRLYPNAPVDGYDVIDAAEALAKFLRCSRVDIIGKALESEHSAKLLLKFAERRRDSALLQSV